MQQRRHEAPLREDRKNVRLVPAAPSVATSAATIATTTAAAALVAIACLCLEL
jgi:hypothetical protein